MPPSTSAPTIISIPSSITAFYISALSLDTNLASVSVNWELGGATFGATFIGPPQDYVLSEKVFGAPIIVQEDGELPSELSVEFQFDSEQNDEGKSNYKVEQSELASCGPAGSSKKVLVTAHLTEDGENAVTAVEKTTVTIMFKSAMRGLRRA